MSEATDQKSPRVTWRELPAWLAVVVAVVGIFLTYWEIRTANERELLFRVWDDTRELYRNSLDVPGNSSKNQVDIEMRLLGSIHAHAGLLSNRSLKEAAFAVSRAWSKAHRNETKDRIELASAIDNMLKLMENALGTYRTVPLPWSDPLPRSMPADAPSD